MTDRDLTRADAERALEQVRHALGGLQHLAIAGVLHTNDSPAQPMCRLVSTFDAVGVLVDILGEWALQLPEVEP
jgi:hypothetical protein